MYVGLASMLLAMLSVTTVVADQLNGSQIVAALAALGGGGLLAAVFRTFMKTYNSSQRWKDTQLERQDAEIKRLTEDNEKCQTSCDRYREQAFKMGTDAFRMHREIGALIQIVDPDTAAKLREILLGSNLDGS